MPLTLGVDLGTTTITALALDTATGDLAAVCTLPNEARTTPDGDPAAGRSEWDALGTATTAGRCLRAVAERLAGRHGELAGLGLTGQQHGVVVVGPDLVPRTPFINWQDRRGDEPCPGTGRTYVERARDLLGPDAPRRTGCRLATGYLAVTLFWLKQNGRLPAAGMACFAVDHFAALLTGRPPVTDPTSAASGGVLDVAAGDWAPDLLAALDLPRGLFPPVRPSGALLGGLTAERAAATGLAPGLPVFVGMGDNQASFLGSVARPAETVLVNVGTGGQVAAYADRFVYDPLLETRPLPRGGFLLVSAGLSGGAAYAVLERFFRAVGSDLLGVPAGAPLYPAMNALAAGAPRGAGGLRCEPFFAGTRDRPELRASWAGVSADNFTPACLTRALLEGMARSFRTGYEAIARVAPVAPVRVVGSGNGLRESQVLAQAVADEFGLPLALPRHREEAAYGAALLAAVGAGIFPDLAAAGRLIRYTEGVGGVP
jgi:sugar (pentulose or hexulose) kinase